MTRAFSKVTKPPFILSSSTDRKALDFSLDAHDFDDERQIVQLVQDSEGVQMAALAKTRWPARNRSADNIAKKEPVTLTNDVLQGKAWPSRLAARPEAQKQSITHTALPRPTKI